MSSISQYLTLYSENKEIINSHSSELLNSRRDVVYEFLKEKNLPQKGDEGFEKISIDEMFAPNYGLNINRINIPVDVAASFRCDVPNVTTLLGVVVNDMFVPTALC